MLNDLKAELSQAYVRAVAHAAGYFVQEAHRTFDGAGIDLTLLARGADGSITSPRLDLQVKATAEPMAEDPFSFDLGVKNYDELRSTALQVPRILVVVVVPSAIGEWVSATERELIIRRCGYWISLRGAAATENTSTVRVRLARSACFHVAEVQAMMDRIGLGGLP